jgi:hypothetical protein
MITHQIKITGSNPITEELILDPIDILADVGDEIEWSIKDPEVYSFKIKKKRESPDIFGSNAPSGSHGKRDQGTISQSSGGTKYVYSIYWRNKKGGKELHFDPIISVKPSSLSKLVLLIISFLGASLLAYLGWKKFSVLKK